MNKIWMDNAKKKFKEALSEADTRYPFLQTAIEDADQNPRIQRLPLGKILMDKENYITTVSSAFTTGFMIGKGSELLEKVEQDEMNEIMMEVMKDRQGEETRRNQERI